MRGHLFVYIDYLIGFTYDAPQNEAQGHPFEVDEVQDLIRAVLRLIVAYYVKITTMPKIVRKSLISLLTHVFINSFGRLSNAEICS